MLREGLDIDSLGKLVESPPPVLPKSPRHKTPPTKRLQPSTPTIVPPTPSPVAGPSSARIPQPSPSASTNDFFTDDDDINTKRRSMYRSPGTSSSPDLATLLRKAKERGGIVNPSLYRDRDRRRDSPPPLPSHSKARDDWVFASPNGNGTSPEKPKSSVRSKASSFLGKMLGQNTVRERSKTDASSRNNATPLYDTFTPPVPPLPQTPVGSPIADVFSSTSPLRPSSPPTTKPLPPIMGMASPSRDNDNDDDDERSMVFVDKITVDSDANVTVKGKRRSMSLSNTDNNVMPSFVPRTPDRSSLRSPVVAKTDEEFKNKGIRPADTTLNGILTDFKGELSQLDPIITSSLDLRDPSTPARRAAYLNSSTNGSSREGSGNTESRRASSILSAPTVTLQPPFRTDDEVDGSNPPSPGPASRRVSAMMSTLEPAMLPRNTPLQTPVRSRDSMTRQSLSPLRSRSGTEAQYGKLPSPHSPTSSSARGLRVIHRSTASSSEPSLIPSVVAADDERIFSQQDLSVHDFALMRPTSSGYSPGRRGSTYTVSAGGSNTAAGEDAPDMDVRGQELASRCWNEDEEFLGKEKIAEWLGGTGRINKIALQHYMANFDFSGLRLDMAFRRLCAKLYLKAETQQVDRILEEFSRRYWDCNPNTLYGSSNLVHAVAYSLLLLNTDLHVAELTSRMTRSQFVRNTLAAIQMQLQPSATSTPPQVVPPDPYEDSGSLRSFPVTGNGQGSSPNSYTAAADGSGMDTITRSKRSDSITSWNSISRDTILSSPALSFATTQATTPNVDNDSVADLKSSTMSSSMVYGRVWEANMENLLKEMYSAIKSQQILQPSNTGRASMSSLSPGGPMLRNRSLRSQPDRLMTLKRGSIRGIQSIMGQGGASPYSSNSSIDGRVSPSPSFATSLNEVTHGSSSSFLSPTLGFASNLSHSIIRETQEDDDRSVHSDVSTGTTISITDEELALLGAPWAKEGMLCRKQYWEAANKRAKDKNWLDVFVVIQKGELSMFTFGENGAGGSGVVGGGNWLSNARPVGVVQLSHSLSHALPPPGYNRQRPYCMVLTLSNGGVYFFQAGTEELVNEWVSTCNYWAARTSKEPLAGGVSNMEYGWNRVPDPAHTRSQSDNESVRDSDVTSIRSGKSSRSRFNWREGAATVRAGQSPWNDRIIINDWKPPMPPSIASLHDEETQLDALRKHVKSLKKDLQKHNELREPMSALYQPRTSNAIKSMSNWEKKSQYLLTEIVKYDSYIDSLQAAMSLRLKKRGEKALEHALNGTSPVDAPENLYDNPEATIPEDSEEPMTPSPVQNSHKRESADAGDDPLDA
ncbi:hypothetical protein BDP27DRAFT_1446168 [Rhodocollybia butyracea]|uniref:SEC7 domain-containing protein n=1 Tax=Rhodocollybia butyracea TaxID=206335 RepID=A0A9P5UA44_9AGAR|nr:hypothetical protein BDP27DRAFT_1446168 [Rhodocollybia butyracea]